MTGKPVVVVAALIALLTYLHFESRIPDQSSRERMQKVLQAIQLHDAELNRDVLMARAGLLPNYDSLGDTARNLDRDLHILGAESAKLTNQKASGTVRHEVHALTAAIQKKLADIEYLKSDNALLRNSVAYFAQNIRTLHTGNGTGYPVMAVASLSDVMLRFVQSPEPSVREEAGSALARVAGISSRRQDLKPVVVHGRLIVDVLPRVDTLLNNIVSSPTISRAESLQRAMLDYIGLAESRAQKFRLVLYVGALALLTYVIFLFTRLRARARELRRKEVQLIQANKMTSLGTLVSGVAHEINNPNQVVLLNSAVLASAWQDAVDMLDAAPTQSRESTLAGLPYSEMRETVSELTGQIQEGARRIERIVSDLKNFARPCAPSQEQFQLNEVVGRALRLLRPVIHRRTDRFEFRPQPGLPEVQGNPQQIEQVVVNLVINALEALPDRQGAVFVSTSADAKRHVVALDVQDEGVGIVRDNMSRLGEPFFTTKEASGGTGLGLAISSSLVALHEGRLEFHSVQGKGTCAKVELPCATRTTAEALGLRP